MKVRSIQVLTWLGVVFPVSSFACPYCNMLNLTTSLENRAHNKWAIIIVMLMLAVPVAMYVAGFRIARTDKVSRQKTWIFTTGLFCGWMITLAFGSFAPTFGILLMHWFYLPLVVHYNGIMLFAFELPILLVLSVLVIPGCYCYYLSKLLLRFQVVRRPKARVQTMG